MATKNYAALAKARIRRADQSERMPRLLVYGRNKKGKTRFAATAPNVLIVDPENGSQEERKLNPDVWPITRWNDLDEIYGFMKTNPKSPMTGKPYEWVALDGMTRFISFALDFVSNQQAERDLSRRPGQIDQRTYGQANKMVEGMLHNFHSLHHVGIILTAQERMIEIKELEDLDSDEEATPASYMYVPDLPPGSRSPLNQIVDVIGRIYVVRGEFTQKVRNSEGEVIERSYTRQRRLWIGPHEMYDTGYRSGYELPDFLANPTVLSVTRAIRNGKVK